MAVLVDRAKMTVSGTPGTGTITLGAAVTDATNGDFQTFAGAGVANGNSVSYTIVDGHNWEVGRGTYTAAGTTLSRGPLSSSAGGAAITATSAAIVFISALAEDLALLAPLASPTFSGTVTAPDAGTWGSSGIASAAAVGLTSGAFLSWNSDTFLGRAAAANIKYGKDAAAPVAQTISFGNVSTGTSNTVGANATLAGSQGTGTGAGGQINFQVAQPGGSGTSQNALTTALTISPANSTQVLVPNGSVIAGQNPGLAFLGDTTTGIAQNSGNFGIWLQGKLCLNLTATEYRVASTLGFSWSSDPNNNLGSDTSLYRRGAASISLGKDIVGVGTPYTLGCNNTFNQNNTSGGSFTIQGSAGCGNAAGGPLIFQVTPAGISGTGQNAFATSLRLDGNGSVVAGNAALATNATDGFLYIPSCAGTPTGTPTTFTGRVPMIYDTTNNKFYIYNSGWKGGAVPGVFS